jgi:hypothetical protein
MDLPVNYNNISQHFRREVREEYARRQGQACYYCGCLLDEQPPIEVGCLPINEKLFPPQFFKYPIHLHHDHLTGMTIGAVHNLCNAVMWQYFGE